MSSGPRKRLAPQKQSPELLVFGYEVRYFQNPTMAAEIEAERHLIRCQGREDLLVDRYDVRLLLDDLDQHTRALPVMPQLSEREKIEEAQLDVARYEDMEAADARLLEGLYHSPKIMVFVFIPTVLSLFFHLRGSKEKRNC